MDWERHRLLIMGVVAAALVGATWWAVSSETGDTPVDETEEAPTLPELERDDITALEITRPAEEGEGTIRLERDGESWRVTSPVEAAAAETSVSTALDKLTDLEVVGRAASSAQHHEHLEVDAEHGIHVVAQAGGETVFDGWIGAFRSGNTMVRLDGQEEVLMVRGSIKFAFNKPVRDWRDRSITDLESGRIARLSFQREGASYTFEKRGDAWAQVLPEDAAEDAGIENYDATRVRTMASSLARMRAADFAAADATPASLGFGEGAARVEIGLVAAEPEAAEGEEEAEGEEQGEEAAEGAEGAEGEAAEPASPTLAETVVLLVGNEAEESQRYVMIEGDETIYLVSRFMADRLLPDAEDFQPGAEPAEPPPGGMPGGMPPGMPGMGGGPGGGQIPPEVMRQIQQQLQQQQGGGGGGH